MAQSLGLLGEDGGKFTHGYIRKSVFYANVGADRREPRRLAVWALTAARGIPVRKLLRQRG